jgi:hypothetical protein
VLNVDPNGFWNRFIAALAGITVASFGVTSLVRGDSSYSNWFGGPVFAPIAVLLGGFAVFCALFKPGWLVPKAPERKHRRR